LPVDWNDMGPLFAQAFPPSERSGEGNPAGNLFHEPTRNRYHIDAARTVGRDMARYLDDIGAAIADAIDKWMGMASVVSLVINGPIGTVLPGGVCGPVLKPLILMRAPLRTEMETEYSNAIAQAVSDAWMRWEQGLNGVLEYPAFAAAPIPMAPPTPNVPVPLIMLGSSGEGDLMPTVLAGAMAAAMTSDGQHAVTLFDAVAVAVYTQFQHFKTATQVVNVLGTGPVTVPPAGPVTGGSVIPTPGNFL
jgi:hypothetical protein